MQRALLNHLIDWKIKKNRLPLLLRGARQVGKSYLVEQFGQRHFEKVVTVNFELQPDCKRAFDDLNPQKILVELSALTQKSIIPEQTLLFLDEIQECPKAIMALRYFKEQMPELHVIGAGSLLEFALRDADFRMPVGRVQFMYLKPLSFQEFLRAHGHTILEEQLHEVSLENPVSDVIHEKLLELVRMYLLMGGMPAVHQAYFDTHAYQEVQSMQTVILETYQRDFSKYASMPLHQYLEQVFIQTPRLLGQQVKYVDISQDMRSRELKRAMQMLEYAGVLSHVWLSNAEGLPLLPSANTKKFKLIYLDVGLAARQSRLEPFMILKDDIFHTARGRMAEQFVGQELLAYQPVDATPKAYYWARDKKGSMAEVDYLVQVQDQLLPIEVKAGKSGKLKSLQLFLREKKARFGVQISQQSLSFDGKVLSLPFYLISQFPRLVSM